MPAVDTNVLVGSITRDSPSQATVAEDFIAKGAWVSVLALTEATWVLSSTYELSPKEIAKAVKMLLEHQSLVPRDSDTVAAALDLLIEKPEDHALLFKHFCIWCFGAVVWGCPWLHRGTLPATLSRISFEALKLADGFRALGVKRGGTAMDREAIHKDTAERAVKFFGANL